MDKIGSDTIFAGSIPELYDTHLVPLIFEPYADDLAQPRRRAAAGARARDRRRHRRGHARAGARVCPRTSRSSRPT